MTCGSVDIDQIFIFTKTIYLILYEVPCQVLVFKLNPFCCNCAAKLFKCDPRGLVSQNLRLFVSNPFTEGLSSCLHMSLSSRLDTCNPQLIIQNTENMLSIVVAHTLVSLGESQRAKLTSNRAALCCSPDEFSGIDVYKPALKACQPRLCYIN